MAGVSEALMLNDQGLYRRT
ncbi:hypothetical protein CGLO_16549 [Colletotrichum gloeosporioides Cg-14]|uniref:Uncharacterized protein n=1 Tax=Colletotrichum gloeosporioides (strain Cg-14) TaxID=1237896 RepID=T0KZ86_COLGC|nr:hypothetical protein CGLO_16549 [Colletotrichum gloeosporioides Cg-14]